MYTFVSKAFSPLKICRSFIRIEPSSVRKSSDVKLSYALFPPMKPVSTCKPPLVILHGVLGSKTNWRSLAKALSSKLGREVYTLDARNHGDSPHSTVMTYEIMMLDLANFLKEQRLSEVSLLGHSMGGRTAILFALMQPEVVEKLIVVDISPFSTPKTAHIISHYMSAMKDALTIIPGNVSLPDARKEADKYLEKFVPLSDIRQFLLTNLTQVNGKFSWRANIDVLQKWFNSSDLPFRSMSEKYNKDTLFICGGNSDFVKPEEHSAISNMLPKVSFMYIPGAGHWVHSEKPKEFIDAVKIFFEPQDFDSK